MAHHAPTFNPLHFERALKERSLSTLHHFIVEVIRVLRKAVTLKVELVQNAATIIGASHSGLATLL